MNKSLLILIIVISLQVSLVTSVGVQTRQCGDCNNDGIVSILDSTVILSGTGFSTADFAYCNVQGTLGDSQTQGATVDVLDALEIARRSSLGLTHTLECSEKKELIYIGVNFATLSAGIYKAPLDGSSATDITPSGFSSLNTFTKARFFGEFPNRKIVFSYIDGPGSEESIGVMDADGRNSKTVLKWNRINYSGSPYLGSLDGSKDGNKILFSKTSHPRQIYELDLTRGIISPVLTGGTGPTYPGGSGAPVVGGEGATYSDIKTSQLYTGPIVCNPGACTPAGCTNHTNGSVTCYPASCAPSTCAPSSGPTCRGRGVNRTCVYHDVETIAFRESSPSPAGGITRVNIDGSDYRKITFNTFDIAPKWSPNGKEIAFSRRSLPSQTRDIYVVESDGTSPPIKITQTSPVLWWQSPSYSTQNEIIFVRFNWLTVASDIVTSPVRPGLTPTEFFASPSSTENTAPQIG